ncbi:hypothetical protein RSSL_00618 [Streptococcus salivarius K12]|uniref:Transposase n=1 Tax=Streptococcus salivarius K12 TaxID=1200793 RepID=J7T511_STRSL|nr:hypothetical protein RSSL_00618 [Streptococcus salivarius K12]
MNHILYHFYRVLLPVKKEALSAIITHENGLN